MTILFPSSALRPRQVESDFQVQADAARLGGFEILLLDSDALMQGEITRALRFVRAPDELQVLVYRGWMLRSELYESLHNALLGRNCRLLNELQAYALCHELPNWYSLLGSRTPRSKWLPIPECFDASRVLEAAADFGSEPLIVKDYVKSRKHEWNDACFIADASDKREVERVTQNFLSRQGENLVGGLVLRQFVPLRSSALDSKTGSPIINEWRLFWLAGELVARSLNGAAQGEEPSSQVLADLRNLAARIESRFFSMDVAQLESGEWTVIELGDGGVSGLPPQMNVQQFYADLNGK